MVWQNVCSACFMKIIPVILSGGSGCRLWPLSRRDYPKQFLPLVSDNTLLQETLLRLEGLDNVSDPIIICNEAHRFLVAQQLQAINITQATILLEPIGRNTAPAIAAAALQAGKENESEEVVLLVLSADHVIKDVDAFHRAIAVAAKQAMAGQLVTFGIVPTEANTGYGYIRIASGKAQAFYKVEVFVEKPDQTMAEQYLTAGNYLWNSGMFVFEIQTLLDELHRHCGEIVGIVKQAVDKAVNDFDFIRLQADAFALSPDCSIDYALLEKSDVVVVVPLEAGWSDVGTWATLYGIGQKDGDGNVITGNVIAQQTNNAYINTGDHLVATIGVDNLIVVHTADATLIAGQDKAKEVKGFVDRLRSRGCSEAESHRKVYRPWGWYDSIETGAFFQVKRLHVNPHARLSLQLHHKRAEHWVVVDGIATVTRDGEVSILSTGQSTYIPVGAVHALENKEDTPLEVIEVQSGSYLGEDDIERLDDIYGRAGK